ncbi:uncharacterized protein [Antedon mediterranea]|uniref:uncharacterized protein n=1 Tax=Antedon mediterranea TaxID=105859 RepID=UPI003AF93824
MENSGKVLILFLICSVILPEIETRRRRSILDILRLCDSEENDDDFSDYSSWGRYSSYPGLSYDTKETESSSSEEESESREDKPSRFPSRPWGPMKPPLRPPSRGGARPGLGSRPVTSPPLPPPTELVPPVFPGPTTEACLEECPLESAPVCGVDGVTYSSACVLRVVACITHDYTLRVAYTGNCIFSQDEPALLCNLACTDYNNVICATNGLYFTTFPNMCAFQQAKCFFNNNLHIAYKGDCHVVLGLRKKRKKCKRLRIRDKYMKANLVDYDFFYRNH